MDSLPNPDDLVEMRIDLPDDQMMIMQPFPAIENSINGGQPLNLEVSTLSDISLLSHGDSDAFSQKKVKIYPQAIVFNVTTDNELLEQMNNKKEVDLPTIVNNYVNMPESGADKITSLVSMKISEDKEKKLAEDMSNVKKGACPFCMKYLMLDRMDRHIKFVHKDEKTKCEKCGKTFKDIFQHMKLRHKIYYHGKGSRLKCKLCGQKFQKEIYCKEHIKKEHHKDMQTPLEKNKVPCTLCGVSIMAVPPNSVWDTHVYPQHMIESKYSTCPVGDGCKFTLPHNVYIKKHLASVHSITATQLLVCDICPKRFYTHQDKEEHQKLEHPQNDMECKFCKETFGFHKALAVHYYEHHKNALVSEILELENGGDLSCQKTKVTKYKLSKSPFSDSKKHVSTVEKITQSKSNIEIETKSIDLEIRKNEDVFFTNNVLDTNTETFEQKLFLLPKTSKDSTVISQPCSFDILRKTSSIYPKPNEKCLKILGLEKTSTNTDEEPLFLLNYEKTEKDLSKVYNMELKDNIKEDSKVYTLEGTSQLESGQIAILGVETLDNLANFDEVSGLIENTNDDSHILVHIDDSKNESDTTESFTQNLEIICVPELPIKQNIMPDMELSHQKLENIPMQSRITDGPVPIEKYPCPFENCTSKLSNMSSLKEHLTRHDVDEIQCMEPGCKKICKNKKLYREHMQYHDRTKAGPVQCTWEGCSHVAKNKTVLEKSHIRKVHHGKNYWKKGDARTKCTECDTDMFRKSLKQHMARYHSEQSLKSNCEICNKLVTSQNMKMHIKMAHTKESTSCLQCGRIALNLDNHKCLKNRMENIEEKQFKYVILK